MRLDELERLLRAELADCDEPRALCRILMEDVAGITPVTLLANPERELPDFMPEKLLGMARRVAQGEPVQYVVGRARFCGLELEVNPAVLIPRPDTALLVDLVVERMRGRKDLRVLDLATGSGCIAIALSRALPFAQVTALDISDAALEVARRNAARLKAPVKFLRGDILGTLPPGEWDVIVSNPPYVLQSEAATMVGKVLDHEPHLALFVPDADPMRFYTPIDRYARKHLALGGMLAFEINPLAANLFPADYHHEPPRFAFLTQS